MRIYYFISLLSIVLFFSCNNENNAIEDIVDNEYVPIVLPAEQLNVCGNLAEFSIDFFKKAYNYDIANSERVSSNGNAWGTSVSPLSAAMVLGMEANAMSEENRNVVLEILKLNENELDILNQISANLIEKLPVVDKMSKVNIANSIWSSPENSAIDSYKEKMNSYYSAEFFQTSMTSPSLVTKVNNWCSQKTDGVIDNLMEAPFIMEDIVSMLNVFLFDGKWSEKFDTGGTVSFVSYNIIINKVPSISKSLTVNCGEKEKFNYVSIPYGNGAYNFTAILPDQGISIDEIVDDLTVDTWNDIRNNTSSKYLTVTLPKFEQNKINQLFGIFSFPDDTPTNFDVFTKCNDNYLLIKQQIKLTVNEEGTKVASATQSGWYIANFPEKIYFNRPFIYFIHEKSTGAILLAGTVMGF